MRRFRFDPPISREVRERSPKTSLVFEIKCDARVEWLRIDMQTHASSFCGIAMDDAMDALQLADDRHATGVIALQQARLFQSDLCRFVEIVYVYPVLALELIAGFMQKILHPQLPVTRSGACSRISQAGSDAGTTSVEQVSIALGPASAVRRPWTRPYLIWVAQLRFTQIAQEATRLDYLHEVEHMRERVARLEQAITEAVKLASPALQQVINDLQALRGIADISAPIRAY
jgi:hypothetical protein